MRSVLCKLTELFAEIPSGVSTAAQAKVPSCPCFDFMIPYPRVSRLWDPGRMSGQAPYRCGVYLVWLLLVAAPVGTLHGGSRQQGFAGARAGARARWNSWCGGVYSRAGGGSAGRRSRALGGGLFRARTLGVRRRACPHQGTSTRTHGHPRYGYQAKLRTAVYRLLVSEGSLEHVLSLSIGVGLMLLIDAESAGDETWW